jgi:pyruvate dehydrogenase E1 component alpha subunit
VIFFGEGATEEGVFHESVNFAALHNLPVLFICENNLYSVYSNISVRQPPKRSLVDLARGHGIWSQAGDGNNVGQVYALAGDAVHHSKSGNGPTLLEFSTYRWREHCGPGWDNDIGYRTEEEYQTWLKECPIARVENELLGLGIPQSTLDQHRAAILDSVKEALEMAKRAPLPEKDELFTDLFA